MISAFKFNHLFVDSDGKDSPLLTLKKFRTEFRHVLSNKRGEIITDVDPSEIIVRFDLIREIFLERGL